MNIAILILAGLTALTLILYTIFYIKKTDLLKTITSILVFPLSGVLAILLLTYSLPDSFQIIFYTGAAYLFSTIAIICSLKEDKILLKTLSLVSYLLTSIIWIQLFRTVFYIYRIPSLLIILSIIFYLAIITVFFIISGKQKMQYHAISFISIAIAAALHFISFIYIFYSHSISRLILFSGTSINLAFTLYYLISKVKNNLKHKQLIYFILLFTSLTLISYSNIILLK